MNILQEIITDEELEKAFGNADFGQMPKRDILKYALLKYAAGYDTGHTARSICRELALITAKNDLTKIGEVYLFKAFYDGNSL